MEHSNPVVKYLFRPGYKTFIERPLWWFLAQIKTFFFAETLAEIKTLQAKLQRLEAIEHRLYDLQADSSARWNATEELLLALFRQPSPQHKRDFHEQESAEIQPRSQSIVTELTATNGQNRFR